MADDGTDIDPSNGESKMDVWVWLMTNIGLVILFWLIVFPIALIKLWGNSGIWWFIGIGTTIIVVVGISTRQSYKELVDGNSILPFARSKFSSIFKDLF